MATTSQILTWIELECHGWQRDGSRGSRALFNEAHRILNRAKLPHMVVYDTTTGDFPYFSTTSGTYRYTAPSTVWLVDSVVVDAELVTDYGGVARGTTFSYERMFHSGKEYARIINIRTGQSTPSVDAWLQFHGVDPGTTSSYYRRIAYAKPTDIASDSIQHQCPEGLDVEYLVPATCKLIECIKDHDKADEARKYIEMVVKPAYANACWKGEHGVPLYVTRRPF